MTTAHTAAVLTLLDLPDPFTAEAQALRDAIDQMERGEPRLIIERVNLFAAHALVIGAVMPNEKKQEGVMLT